MCDYCDCRRIPEIADLGAEHDRIEDLADEVLQSLKNGSSAASELLGRLIDELSAHVAREERGLFVEARGAGLAPEYVDDLEDDHRRFASVLSDPGALDAEGAEKLFDEIHRHIAVEEYDLFPAAAQVLTEDQWERVTGG